MVILKKQERKGQVVVHVNQCVVLLNAAVCSHLRFAVCARLPSEDFESYKEAISRCQLTKLTAQLFSLSLSKGTISFNNAVVKQYVNIVFIRRVENANKARMAETETCSKFNGGF